MIWNVLKLSRVIKFHDSWIKHSEMIFEIFPRLQYFIYNMFLSTVVPPRALRLTSKSPEADGKFGIAQVLVS